ncbi:MAG: GNAT family N-acetyltransferase [Planctomycetota bacterium]
MLTPHEAAGAGLRHRRAELHREDLIFEVIKANMAYGIDSGPVRWLERSAAHPTAYTCIRPRSKTNAMIMSRRRIQDEDRPAIAEFIERHWSNKMVMSRGRCYYPHQENGVIEWRDGRIVGLVTWLREGDDLQLLTLNSVLEGQGIGSALTLLAIEEARRGGVRKIWLTTTNDNLPAIGLYQRLGFRMTAVNVGAVDEARKTKPQIAETGYKGIPIHDEVVLELDLQPSLH